MSLIDAYFNSWSILLTWSGLLFFMLGIANGMFFGVIPGLSGSVGIALMIPLVGGIGENKAIILFTAALSAQTFAGSVSAILLNTPGTAPNAATTLDGYQMTLKGKAGMALGISACASAMGTLIGTLVIVALLPFVRATILAFSFPEFALLSFIGLAGIAIAAKGSILKGVISGLIGLGFSFIGFSPVTGELRLVFNNPELLKGVDAVGALIGLYALTEAIKLVSGKRDVKQLVAVKVPFSQVWGGVKYVFTKPFLLIRSSAIGAAVGIVPAMGGTVAAFMAYFAAQSSSKTPELFGTGHPDGVLAPEASNDAKDAGSALPSLAFGIPGSSDWAIILGALVVQGIQPGPMLIKEQPTLMWLAIVTIACASFITSGIGLALSPLALKVTKLRPPIIGISIAAVALTGAYGLDNKIVDVIWAIVFGAIGYFMSRSGYPTVPLILGLLLGKGFESNFNHTVSIMDGGLAAFVTRPISLVLLSLSLLIIYSGFKKNKKASATVVSHSDGVSAVTNTLGKETKLFIGFVAITGVFLLVNSMLLDQRAAKIFPLIVAIGLLGSAALYWVIGTSSKLSVKFAGLIGDAKEVRSHAMPDFKVFGINPELVVLGSLFGYLILTTLVGPAVGLVILGLFLLKKVANLSWKSTLITLISLFGFLWLIFMFFFNVTVSYGLLPIGG